MGFIGKTIGSVLGAGGGGANFQAKAANLMNPVDMGQINSAYSQAQSGLGQQQDFLNALQAQNGIGNQADVYNQFQGVANGTGPNPALQQLQNTTGQNIANQAALMAGQRGTGANAGLLARQAAQQGAGIQQQAIGQGAAIQAQQQLAAMNVMAGISGQQVAQQGSALTGLNQFGQNEQANLLGAAANLNQSQVGSVDSQNKANAAIQAQNQKSGSGLLGGLLGGAGMIAGTMMGGPIGGALGKAAATSLGGGAKMADGGMVGGPASFVGRHLKGYSNGAVVPGNAKVSGDSLKNDTVPAMLSPGEIVIPRHVIQSEDPAGNSAKFVQAVMAKQGR